MSYGFCRYQSIRRTITSRRLDFEDGISGSGDSTQSHSQAMSDGSGSSSGGEQQRSQQHADIVHHMPAVRFISRPDFFSILHMNQVFIHIVQISELMSFGYEARLLLPLHISPHLIYCDPVCDCFTTASCLYSPCMKFLLLFSYEGTIVTQLYKM
jgi:hypothetical protein